MNNYSLGIDIVDISELQKKIDTSSLFLQKILSEQESANFQLESIAGKIAAKEAIIKTGFIKAGDWKRIAISTNLEGIPIVLNNNGTPINNIKITISHTAKIAVAFALYEKD